MSLRIFGVGLGVIVMMLIWIFSIAICIMCIRIRRTVIAITALVIEVFITLIIISWPLAAPTTISEKVEVSIGIPMETVDYIGIPRFILVIVEAVILLIFCIEYVKYDLTTPAPASTIVLD
ncbi:putative integral membrane protein [Acanthocheilonema viteae]